VSLSYLTLKTKACLSETSVNCYHVTWSNNAEEITIRSDCVDSRRSKVEELHPRSCLQLSDSERSVTMWESLSCHEQAEQNVRFEVFTAVTMRMVSSGMLRRVALVRTDASEEPSTSFIRVTWYFFAACVSCQLQLASFLVH
jgi:hypothetical protein